MPVESKGKSIIEKATGKVIGHSKSAKKAAAAARVRNAISHTSWRPTKGRMGSSKY